MCQLSVDIISNLPRDVIDNILTRLPLREAGRTSILSRRWRYTWANLPSLIFDCHTFTGTTMETQEGLLLVIHEVLLLKRVPIVKFVLSLPGLKSCRQIDPFVSFLSRNCGFKELTLHILEADERYKLQPPLFSCVDLTRLSLEYCAIEPPIQFNGFKRLVLMEISDCWILPGVLSDLISGCPLLEELKVTYHEPADGHIEISAPNLRGLILIGGFTPVIFKYTPCLSSCVLLFVYGSHLAGESSNAVKSFRNLVAIEDLQIQLGCCGDVRVDNNLLPRKLTSSLNHLKSLTLSWISIDILFEVSLILCLIRSSPNLTKIVVLAVAKGRVDGDLEQISRLLEVQEWSGMSLNSLREARVYEVTGKRSELEFIKLLLAISPKLETMVITSNARDVALQERLEISTKMTRFRRSSPLAEIIYKY